MTLEKRLQGKVRACPFHDDDYEACIGYSGTAPCYGDASLEARLADAQAECRAQVLKRQEVEGERDCLARALTECRLLMITSGMSGERFQRAMVQAYDALTGHRRRCAGVEGRAR